MSWKERKVLFFTSSNQNIVFESYQNEIIILRVEFRFSIQQGLCVPSGHADFRVLDRYRHHQNQLEVHRHQVMKKKKIVDNQ